MSNQRLIRNQDVIQAAKDHGVQANWVHEALLNYDVKERGLSFACYYGAAMQNVKARDHVAFMKQAMKSLNYYRGIES